MSATFWITTISSIATALMAIGTFITIVITIKQNREALRARLIFAIVRKDDYVCLKVANVGNSVATNIQIRFSQNLKDMLMVDTLKERFQLLERTPLSIDAHDAKYYCIVPICDKNAANYCLGNNDRVNSQSVCDWHEQYKTVEFMVYGKYCGCYTFQEKLSIVSFLNVGAVETNEIAEVLRQQNEILRKLNKLLQTSLDAHK